MVERYTTLLLVSYCGKQNPGLYGPFLGLDGKQGFSYVERNVLQFLTNSINLFP